ncbi:MAG: hypothetical protein ACKOWQ_06740 [Aquirufa sp.]
MKKVIFTILALSIAPFTFAQKANQLRIGFELGKTLPSNGTNNTSFAFEAKYNLKKNLNIGLREVLTTEVSTNSAMLLTSDYYFHKEGNSIAPFVGIGAGPYLPGIIKPSNDSFQYEITDPNNTIRLDATVRAGFEFSKFRFTTEYNMVPSASQKNYLNISFGIFLDGGRWK